MKWRPVAAATLTLLPIVVAVAGAQSDEQANANQLILTDSDRQILGQPEGRERSGGELAAVTEDLTSRMRCPVCQGLSIADSPTPAAVAMKARVEGLLAAGYSEEQILRYFEASYGEFIRLAPKPVGINLVAWLLPLVAIAAAAAWLTLRARRRPQAEEDLSDYVEQVRREVER